MKKISQLLLVISLIFSITARANDSVAINKGEQAPFTGILLTTKKAESVRRELIEKDQLEIKYDAEVKKNVNLNEIIVLKDEEIDLYKKQNERLNNLKDNNEKMKYVWFGLGVLATGLAVYGAGQLSK